MVGSWLEEEGKMMAGGLVMHVSFGAPNQAGNAHRCHCAETEEGQGE